MQLEEMKSEPREDQLNKAVVGPKLDIHLREGERVLMKTGAQGQSQSQAVPPFLMPVSLLLTLSQHRYSSWRVGCEEDIFLEKLHQQGVPHAVWA